MCLSAIQHNFPSNYARTRAITGKQISLSTSVSVTRKLLTTKLQCPLGSFKNQSQQPITCSFVLNIAPLWIHFSRSWTKSCDTMCWVKQLTSARMSFFFFWLTQINYARAPIRVYLCAPCSYMRPRLYCVSPRSLTHESGGPSNSRRSCPRCWNQTRSAPQRDAQFTYDPPQKLTTKVRLGCFNDPRDKMKCLSLDKEFKSTTFFSLELACVSRSLPTWCSTTDVEAKTLRWVRRGFFVLI